MSQSTRTDSPSSEQIPDHSVSRWDGWLFDRLVKSVGELPVEIVLWNGESRRLSDAEPVARLRFRDRAAFRQTIRDPNFQFGEQYASGGLTIDGDLVELLRFLLNRELRQRVATTWLGRLAKRLRRPNSSSISAARDNIHHHYDLGNEFYKLWLDEQMVYTCAYFTDQAHSIERAQIDKMDHVARKLCLKPGQHVIEAGCGWGALALHFVKYYGVTVTAYNISQEQVAHARERALREGLADRVEYVLDDWRNIEGKCDAFVSVGMLEHVGKDNYELLGRIIRNSLRRDGLGLIHSIGRNRPYPADPWMERRIFPGGYAPSLGEMLSIFEPHELSVLDVENIRLHYARTLEHWRARFEQVADDVSEEFDEEFVRVWRLYLAGSQVSFELGNFQLFQLVFARARNNSIPLTRNHVYSARPEERSLGR